MERKHTRSTKTMWAVEEILKSQRIKNATNITSSTIRYVETTSPRRIANFEQQQNH